MSNRLTVNQFIASVTRVLTQHVAMPGEFVQRAIPVGIEVPRFEASEFDPTMPNKVGYIGGKPVITSYDIGLQPVMEVSPKFRKLQSPQLVKETQQWMTEFFGEHRPIYVYDVYYLMHPDTLRQYMQRRGQL